MFTLGLSSSSSNSFFMILIHSAFLLCFFLFNILHQSFFKFYFFCFRLRICFCALSTNQSVEFSFLILECPVLFVLFDSVRVPFVFSFFCQYLLIHFSSCIFRLVCFCPFGAFLYYYLLIRFFYISVSLELEFELQLVSSNHQDSSQYSQIILNNVVVLMVSTRPPTPKSPVPLVIL